ncbi:MAG TPA: hypothetical protein VEK57_10995 [Thermoanaerobaculia bacterium]|nr:hypothetical protein [Thermoanaerobaculia bacterium]
MRQLVRSMFICVLAAGFAVQSFASCPAAPSLLAPANGSEVSPGNITLDWSDDGFATSFDVYFGLNQDPPTLQGTVTQSQKQIFMEPGYSLTWFVKAKADTCTDIASATHTFSTKCPTNPPNLLGPAAGATFPPNQTVTFGWTGVPGAASYDLAVFHNDMWTNLVENHPTTTFAAPFADEGDYLWSVRANFNGSCTPLFSEQRELVIGTPCQTAGPPDLLSPPDASTATLPVTFEWTPREGATGYVVFVHKIGDNLPRVLTRTGNSSYTTDELEDGTFQWWVAAAYENCPDAESASRFVRIERTCPTIRPTLIAPQDEATGITNPVTFRWNAVSGALSYTVIGTIDGEPEIFGTTNATELTRAIDGSLVNWAVRAFFGEECNTTSDFRRFRMQGTGPVCPTVPPALVSPANGAANVLSPVTFSWTAVTNATNYFLVVALGDGDFQPYGSTTDTSLEKFVPAGAVRWAVVATFDDCPELRSAVSAFTVAPPNCPDATITLTTPANGATVNSPVRLAWTAVSGAEAYRIWVSIDGDAPVNILRTQTNEATLSLPAGQIKWYVDALRPNCKAILSGTGEFRVAQGTNCAVNTAPGIVSPAGTRTDPTGVTSPVTLQWTGVERAIGYRVWVGKGEAFSDVKLTRETSAVIQLAPGIYGWFVQALFEGCDPRASATAFFEIARTTERCPSEAPAILEPGEGAIAASPVTFRWTDIDRAVKYRVFASLDGAEPILLGVTNDNELTRALPPGIVDWSVEAVFEECPSTFSPRVRFTIPRAQNCTTTGADLLLPGDGSTITGAVDFAWAPVAGAVKYVLVVKVNDGSPTAVASTSETHFVVENPPPGNIEWWVITFFAGCDPVDSEHGRFGVTRPQCENRRPILLIPRDEVPSPVSFQWTRVPRATGYKLWVQQGEDAATVVASTTEPGAEVELPEGTYIWYVDAEFTNCPPTRSASGEFQVTAPVPCGTPEAPEAQVVGQALSKTDYRLRWTPLPNVDLYEVQESTTPDFADAQTFATEDTSLRFSHEVSGNPVQYLYRVRGVSDCNDERGPYSDPIGVFIIAPRTNNASAEIGGETNVVQTIFLPGSATPTQFLATADKPWLTITPSSGNLPAEGITLTVTADPSVLALGTNTGTIRIQYTTAAKTGDPVSNATTTSSIPLSVSLVTPVIPTGKGTPPPDSLIFPIVGHAVGVNNSLFESDIRVTNLTAQTKKYQLNFTPSGVDGTQTGSSSTIEIAPNGTMAMDDIVSSLFGTGTISSATGMLEVRPLTTSSSTSNSLFSPVNASTVKLLQTAASSRTYNFTPTGTFGQYIPAIRFADFVGKPATGSLPSILSLQQVAQSSAYRANFGFAEASGNGAEMLVRVYNTTNQLLATIPVALQPGEHRQINGMLANSGINNLTDGRVEVEVTNGTGKVTAYVSQVDNKTNDPLLVSAVVKGATTSNRYVVPGTAYINSGFVFWVTDLRIFNAGTTSTPATLTFYPQANPGGAVSRQVTIDAGEIEVLDNVIGDLFAQPNGAGGMVTITTPTSTKLTATARTYNKTSNGTYGQYIPGVTPAESVGASDRALQLLQLEQSSRFRTNVGLAETTGQPATIEVSLIVPDSLVTPVVTINLAANEFRQISLADFGMGSALYNARVAVKVVSGTGRVTAYGSAIDLTTQDPTYVPAQ